LPLQLLNFDSTADPDPAFHSNADPDAAFQKMCIHVYPATLAEPTGLLLLLGHFNVGTVHYPFKRSVKKQETMLINFSPIPVSREKPPPLTLHPSVIDNLKPIQQPKSKQFSTRQILKLS
jgi:hypothetical protein